MPFASLEHLPPIVEQRGGLPSLLRDEMRHQIDEAIRNQPRSLQRRIGPSELGIECVRCLARKLAGRPEADADTPWRPFVGTAVHAALADVFTQANAGLDTVRWLVEHRVDVGEVAGEAITGSADLYDRVTATVVDYKVVGPSSLRRYRAAGPSEVYQTQAHLYGRGFTRRGAPVDTVAIWFLPSNGELSEAHWWAEPYDEQIAVAALTRADTIAGLIATAGADAVIASLPETPGCHSCKRYWLAGSTTNPTAA